MYLISGSKTDMYIVDVKGTIPDMTTLNVTGFSHSICTLTDVELEPSNSVIPVHIWKKLFQLLRSPQMSKTAPSFYQF